MTPWPSFVFEIFDYARMRDLIHQYFHSLGLGEGAAGLRRAITILTFAFIFIRKFSSCRWSSVRDYFFVAF